MNEAVELRQLLAAAESEGLHDSEGHFTIDTQAALGKLAAFQLSRPSAWVLKIVQAAVCSGADSLKISQMRKATIFEFSPAELLEIGAVEKCLTSNEDQSDSMVQNLGLGLRALGLGQGRSFALSVSQAGSKSVFIWDGRALICQDSTLDEKAPPAVTIAVGFEGKSDRTLSSRSRLTLEEKKELEIGCQACPIEVRLDKRRLDTLAYQGESKGDVAILSLSWRPATEPEVLPSLCWPKGIDTLSKGWRAGDPFVDNRVFLVDGMPDSAEISSLMKLSYHYRISDHGGTDDSEFTFESYAVPSTVHWLVDGVITCSEGLPIRVPRAVEMQLFLSAKGLQTDISQMEVMGSVERSLRLARGLREGISTFEKLADSLQGHEIKPLNAICLYQGSFLILHGLAMALVTKGFTLPIHGWFVYKMFTKMATDLGKLRDDCVNELEGLQGMLETLIQRFES